MAKNTSKNTGGHDDNTSNMNHNDEERQERRQEQLSPSASSCFSWSNLLTKTRQANKTTSASSSCSSTQRKEMNFRQFKDEFLQHLPRVVQQLLLYTSYITNNERQHRLRCHQCCLNANNRDAFEIRDNGFSIKESSHSDSNGDFGMTKERILTKVPKQVILDTRIALRFGISCLNLGSLLTIVLENHENGHQKEEKNGSSCHSENGKNCYLLGDNVRKFLQNEFVIKHRIHLALGDIIMRRNHQKDNMLSGDEKCYTMSSKLLCNLITCNNETSSFVVAECKRNDYDLAFHLEPSLDKVANEILTSLSKNDDERNRHNDINPADADYDKINWVDLILSCAHNNNRNALAAIIATMHNCIVSLQQESQRIVIDVNKISTEEDEVMNVDNNECSGETVDIEKIISPTSYQTQDSFSLQIASSKMVISTLLRQIISVHSLRDQFDAQKNNGGKEGSKETSSNLADDATEWIVLLISKLFRLGLIRQLYNSAGGGETKHSINDGERKSDKEVLESMLVVTPEQVVLLHCIENTVTNDWHQSFSSSRIGTNYHPLGGEIGSKIILESHEFLSQEACTLYSECYGNNDDELGQLKKSAYVNILDILASSLGRDGNRNHDATSNEVENIIAESRLILGQGKNDKKMAHNFFVSVLSNLACIVDEFSLTENNSSRDGNRSKSLNISKDRQRLLVILVRLVGNLCYKCKQNQDMLRTTLLPCNSSNTNCQGNVHTTQRNRTNPDESSTNSLGEQPNQRTGLDVLLSCTSLSFGCFTLREWSIFAIRNVLENNIDNQLRVKQLEAQQAVNTHELQNMGIKVDVNTTTGQVEVSPTEKR